MLAAGMGNVPTYCSSNTSAKPSTMGERKPAWEMSLLTVVVTLVQNLLQWERERSFELEKQLRRGKENTCMAEGKGIQFIKKGLDLPMKFTVL